MDEVRKVKYPLITYLTLQDDSKGGGFICVFVSLRIRFA